MPSNGSKPLGFCLPGDLLQCYRSHHQVQTAWQSVWRRCVATPLSVHTHPVRFERGRLTVHADAAVWATQLRHQLKRLQQSLQQQPLFADLSEIQVRVRPPATALTPAQAQEPPSRPALSAPARRLLRKLADSVQDPGLSQSLKRLSESK